ncbi:hypothetical protein TUM19329_03120 [Legionella antarctica]|uniref:Uncharacterized protein n=1 Tax=Legionella antarctica TaxID=2708020 RepID=A0A6F8T0G3_9GAMM|nr:hypothetical protein [Legionella antarctica]BCA93951.1 hypothetical protein TUM19329_03120 [Legionella antarctica]
MSKFMMTVIGGWIMAIIASSTYANVANEILLSRSSDQKTQILSNIINAAGEPCLAIESFFQGVDLYDSAYWNVACSNGKMFTIQIASDSTHSIFPCAAMQSIGAECFKKFGTSQPARTLLIVR